MRRNLELENWLIETTGEEMMDNHLGSNWKRFNDEIGFYPNISMTIADQVWQHQQSRVDEANKKADEAFEAGCRMIDTFKAEQRKREALQKRMDAVQELFIDLKKMNMEDGSMEVTSELVEEIICDLEQALKGES